MLSINTPYKLMAVALALVLVGWNALAMPAAKDDKLEGPKPGLWQVEGFGFTGRDWTATLDLKRDAKGRYAGNFHCWSRDNSFLLWRVAGKWSPRALVLVRIHNGSVLWQLDLRKPMHDAILKSTKKASPYRYSAAMHEFDKSKDYFTIGIKPKIEPGKRLTFPLRVIASLSSNVKGIETFPKEAELDSELTAVITQHGAFRVTGFTLKSAR